MLPSLIFSSLWLKFKVAKISHRSKINKRIKNDRGSYVTKQARQVWGGKGGMILQK